MTESKAIKELSIVFLGEFDRQREAKDLAIKALEEIQQYRAIGTVEECQEAVEKQREMKMSKGYDNGRVRKCCGRCGCFVLPASKYCSKCGQRLDWSIEE